MTRADVRPPLKALLAHVRPHRRVLYAAGGLALVGAAGGLAQPLAAREVLERLSDDASLLVPLLILVGLVAVSAVFSAAQLWLLERTSERVVLRARRRLSARLMRMPLVEFDRHAPGDLVSRATSDATLLGSVASVALVQLVAGSVALVAAIVLMGVIDLALLGVTVAVLVVIGGAVATLLPRILRAAQRQQDAVGGLGAALERALGGLRTVRASGAEDREIQTVDAASQRAYDHGMQSAGYHAIVGTATGLIVQVSFLAVLGVGGARVAAGSLEVGDLIAFLLYLFYLSEPIASLAMGATQLQQGLAAVERIDAVTALPVEDEGGSDASASGGGVDVTPVDPLVRFTAVSFRYQPDRPPVLRDVSFDVAARGLTALVGPSGAGKTTLFALLERFYEPTGGAITFAGRDLADWPRAALRAQIGYVEQDAPVLSGTLRDNLVYAAPDASQARVLQVLRDTRLQELVDRLPEGLDTEVGSRGTALSGGERQRIAIARALLRRPMMLLLDEAASQLDARNELALRETMTRAGAAGAVLAIAHRLSTVVAARRIIVLDGGRVRAVGTHAELIGSDDLYAELAATQLRP